MSIVTVNILLFIVLAGTLGFILPELMKQHRSVKPSKQKMLGRFNQLEYELLFPITDYHCYQTGHESVWLDADYEEFKQSILDSYYIDKHHGTKDFQVFLYKLDEAEKKIYFATANYGEEFENYDWSRLLHHEEWVSRPNPIKQRIDAFNTERRKKSKNSQWWEFWKIDDFE